MLGENVCDCGVSQQRKKRLYNWEKTLCDEHAGLLHEDCVYNRSPCIAYQKTRRDAGLGFVPFTGTTSIKNQRSGILSVQFIHICEIVLGLI